MIFKKTTDQPHAWPNNIFTEGVLLQKRQVESSCLRLLLRAKVGNHFERSLRAVVGLPSSRWQGADLRPSTQSSFSPPPRPLRTLIERGFSLAHAFGTGDDHSPASAARTASGMAVGLRVVRSTSAHRLVARTSSWPSRADAIRVARRRLVRPSVSIHVAMMTSSPAKLSPR